MKHKSIRGIRKEFRESGIFYTPPELAEKLRSYIDNDPASVYDPACGAGSLLSVFPDSVRKYGQELDAEQLALIDLPNFTGYAGDTLMDDGFAGMQFDGIVANPPFSVKWNPEALKDDPRFTAAPCMPPPSKADWAFMLHILHHLADGGVAAVICFPGILYRGQREGKIRQWFVEQNYIDRVITVPRNTFEDTGIETTVVTLRKKRAAEAVVFEDGERARQVMPDEIRRNGYSLSVSLYLPPETPEADPAGIEETNREVVELTLERIDGTFEMLLSLQEIFPGDDLHSMELYSGLRGILQKHEAKIWEAEFARRGKDAHAAD